MSSLAMLLASAAGALMTVHASVGADPFAMSCPSMEQDVDYAGNDIGKKLAVDSAGACCDACQSAHKKSPSACQFWSYNPSLQHCYFKSSDAGRRPRDKQVSGTVSSAPSPPSPSPSPPTPSPGTQCSTDMDCSLNGKCRKGSCECDPGWKGDACDVLDFRPMASKAEILKGAYQGGYASWGASVFLENGQYHMFAAEMAEHCGLNSYTYNSVVVHAVAEKPEGPFVRDAVVVPNQAHNPTVVRAPNGSWVLYHTGCGQNIRKVITGCNNNTTPSGAKGTVGPLLPPDAEGYQCHPGYGDPPNIFVSDSLDGPWHLHGLKVNTSKWFKHFDNPAPYIFSNGSVLALSRRYPTHGSGNGSQMGIVLSEDWFTGTYVYPERRIPFLNVHSIEDPFLWRNKRGHFHALFHNWAGSTAGAHAFSPDGLSWTWSPMPTYTKTVELVDGSSYTFDRRERPHLLFDDEGNPTHLYNGVQSEENRGTTGQKDFSYTFVQATSAAPEARSNTDAVVV